jgi:LytS/YehU family sensor histidine kinase
MYGKKGRPMPEDTGKNRLSLFWILQISGWFLYWASHLLASTVRQGWSSYQFTRFTTSSFSGFLVTLFLRYLYKKTKYRSRPILFLVVIGFLYSLLAANILVWVANILRIPLWGTEATLFADLTLLAYVKKVMWWILPFVGWSAFYFGIKFWQASQMQKERTEKANALVQSAQLQSLRYRLNPHFLFNALNSIRALIGEDKKGAKTMITELSEVLRYTLVSKNYHDVPLKNEIEAIRHYLAIEKIRYEDKLDVSFELDPTAGDFPVLSFILFPLVENAVKHGMKTSPMPLRINIIIKVKNNFLGMEVKNSGKWIESSSKEDDYSLGTGLNNIRYRLNEEYKERHHFNISEKNGYVSAVMEILYN